MVKEGIGFAILIRMGMRSYPSVHPPTPFSHASNEAGAPRG
jgi:hypothetical protein